MSGPAAPGKECDAARPFPGEFVIDILPGGISGRVREQRRAISPTCS
jgi:hypothetical protein